MGLADPALPPVRRAVADWHIADHRVAPNTAFDTAPPDVCFWVRKNYRARSGNLSNVNKSRRFIF